ncbi:replication initiation protein [Pectobacterium brasiliense]|uniref:replication initiation protein n=1 Tax=Pectobacterium brasiliense TaxID=180957 RepID=UPI0015DE64EE|nr:replication initiation protein [Pectobacterium brasiliense]MBA0216224.1 replication initiation protein [Pectobacterium brasiliense]MBN3073640.1 replication initiation protein [Pectobacterium brasiliense]
MILNQNIYNIEKYKSQIQEYVLCCDNPSKGVYRRHKEIAFRNKYIAYNNRFFTNGLVFDIDHEYGAIAWDLVGLPKPNIIIQNTNNGHAHLLYALKSPVLKTDAAKIKPLKFAAYVQAGLTERLKADRAYADVLMRNPLNKNESRTICNNIPEYELAYLSDFVREDFSDKNKKQNRSNIYGLGRNVNLFEDLRKIAYKDVLKYKSIKSYDDFFNDMFSKAIVLNNYSNAANLLSLNEVRQICKSITKWTWDNFSKEKFSEIQSARAQKTRRTNLKTKLDQVWDIL